VEDTGQTWGIVLAGGSGTRLSGLTTDADGTVIPKQFCSLGGGESLLRDTLRRLGEVVDLRRILVVVSAAHRRWWEAELDDLPPGNVIVQPCNRGTACGVLLPLMTILNSDARARVLVTPSDHHVTDEEALQWSLMEALAHVSARPALLVLLGIEPDHADTSYGWVTAELEGEDPIRPVISFVEKPDEPGARRLLESGALWSSFIFAATAESLLERFRQTLPWLVDRFSLTALHRHQGDGRVDLSSLYESLPSIDFSASVLERAGHLLHVLAVPPCGWTDLGTPARVAECLRGAPCPIPGAACADAPPAPRPGRSRRLLPPIDLASALDAPHRVHPAEH